MESEKRWCENCMSNTLHEILDSDKVMVGKKTKFYQDEGIPKEKLETFFNTAKKEIKNKNLRNILSNFIE